MKKITKILDSVMSGLKRTCVAKAIAVVAVATIAMNSFAQEVETITGVKDLAGKDLTYINSHLTTDGKYPAEMDKMFFLYNEKTGKFLNLGSYWAHTLRLLIMANRCGLSRIKEKYALIQMPLSIMIFRPITFFCLPTTWLPL